MNGTTPYEEIAEVVENWAKDNFYTDFIVAIRADGEELTEILVGDNGELVWLNDWWEGQKDVKLLGFRPINMISVRGAPETVTEGDKIRAMTDTQLAAFLTKVQIGVLNDISDKLGVERHKFDGYDIALNEARWTAKLKQGVSDNG